MAIVWIFLFCLVGLGIYKIEDYVIERQNKKFWQANTNKNFPFKCYGKTLWYSRSCAVSLYTFCKNSKSEWCVLVNQRGEGTPDFQGYWNVPCGYLDFNETGEGGAIRETFEETGIEIPTEQVKFAGLMTSPNENRQNVSLRYYAKLPGRTSQYKFNTEHMEKNEVGSVKWVPISKIDKYMWAFNHDKNIMTIFEKYIDIKS